MDTCNSILPSGKHQPMRERLNLVVVGHVDHGKSSIIGRLLADTKSLPKGKIESIEEKCKAQGKRFEYAFLLDALQDEQSQGITIDAARIFFSSKKRDYIIIDAPGHIEFLKNMISGASQAEAALLVIDAKEGIQENSRRHAYMLSMLGIKQVVVLINKMDLVDYSRERYEELKDELGSFLENISVKAQEFIPISALGGEGLVGFSQELSWYTSSPLLAVLDSFSPRQPRSEDATRMFVQDVYKFTRFADERRIVAGTLEFGSIAVGDELAFYPSGKRSTVASIESFPQRDQESVSAGQAIGITLKEQLYISRGELLSCLDSEKPMVGTRVCASIFWLGDEPLSTQREYLFKLGTARVRGVVEKFERIIDSSSLESISSTHELAGRQVAECVLRFEQPIAFDESAQRIETSRFVIIDDFRIAGGGIIRQRLEDQNSAIREKAISRNARWIRGQVSLSDRIERNGHPPKLVLVSGAADAKRKELARALEASLFTEGFVTYFMGIGNIVYGLDSDLDRDEDVATEHIRRFAEVANIVLGTGTLFVVSVVALSADDIQLISELVGYRNVLTIWLGDSLSADTKVDLEFSSEIDFEEAVASIKEHLQDSFEL